MGKQNGKAKGPNFPSQWVATAQLSLTSNAIIKRFIERGSFNIIYGPSGSGKSFLTADICQHIARGVDWQDHKTSQCLVVYVAAEAGASIMRRFIGWRNETFSDGAEITPHSLPLAVLTRGPDLLTPDGIKDLASDILDLEKESGHKVGLVVFDTLSRSIPGGDENSAHDMTRTIQAADFLRDTFGCATLYVHHTGKDPERGARGHSSLFAAADLVVLVVERYATVEKVRDGQNGEAFYFKLTSVLIGEDEDGEPVGTCIVEYAAHSERRPKPAAKVTGKNQRIVYPVLKALAADRGERSPGTSAIPQGVLLASYTDLVERCTPKFAGDEAFRAREKIKDAVAGLQGAGAIGVHGDIIWILN